MQFPLYVQAAYKFRMLKWSNAIVMFHWKTIKSEITSEYDRAKISNAFHSNLIISMIFQTIFVWYHSGVWKLLGRNICWTCTLYTVSHKMQMKNNVLKWANECLDFFRARGRGFILNNFILLSMQNLCFSCHEWNCKRKSAWDNV